MSWRKRIDVARLSVVKAGKGGAAIMHKVAVQGMERAKLHGAKLARHVVAIQEAAGATPKMMRESAKSVGSRPMTRESDRAWQRAYMAEAESRVPGLAPRSEPAMVPAAPAGPERPVWPNAGPSAAKPDLEAGQ